PQDVLDAGQVEPELGRQVLDRAQPLKVALRVEPRAAGRALRTDETLVLVNSERLRMHADDVGGDADHVARAIIHRAPPAGSPSRPSSGSRALPSPPSRASSGRSRVGG